MRLKRVLEFDEAVCAVAECTEPSAVIDCTGHLAPGRVPLCERHWDARSEEDEPEPAKTTPPCPPLPPAEVDPRQMALPL